ncbi:head GIN domain-containing protein [Flavobacterium haoranii]|uniref:Putative auto-transporter adhesin, head GIN domain n=1 Tax=Flavobacterium haoranii TaxID=683124 RepID=A0A1M6ENV3_9FLAO|nr:head GIN domain-containing protein [Flavobacterium haoranii]SHI87141.1 Putative auto-transporter adhesin, head GIN domain [Flavobacterium haoranii]
MKQTFLNIIAFSIFSFGFSQVEKNLGDFHKVTSFDQIDLQLVKSLENKIIIKGSGSSDVEVVNKNGELKIRMPLTKLLQGDNISATLYYTKLEALEANEGSRIASTDVFSGSHFDIILKEGSEINIELDVDKLTARTSNGSILTLKGRADFTDVLVNSGAKYEADELETKQTTITANAGGIAKVHATAYVNAKVRAGGDIVIFGKPKQIDQKIVAGGSIEQAN